VAREERGVEIQAAEARGFENALRENLAVGGDDHEVRRERAEILQRGGRAEFFGLLDGEVLGEGDLFDHRHPRLQIAARWLVRLRDHADDSVLFRIQKSPQRRSADLASSAKNNSHRLQHPPGAGLAGHRRAGHHELAGCDLALAERGRAAGAEVVIDFLIGQDEQELLADRHGGLAFFAI